MRGLGLRLETVEREHPHPVRQRPRRPAHADAVTDNVNQSKSDQDPAEWLPQYGKCRYVREWTAIKIRWSLKVDRAERSALLGRASSCEHRVLKVRRARVGLR